MECRTSAHAPPARNPCRSAQGQAHAPPASRRQKTSHKSRRGGKTEGNRDALPSRQNIASALEKEP